MKQVVVEIPDDQLAQAGADDGSQGQCQQDSHAQFAGKHEHDRPRAEAERAHDCQLADPLRQGDANGRIDDREGGNPGEGDEGRNDDRQCPRHGLAKSRHRRRPRHISRDDGRVSECATETRRIANRDLHVGAADDRSGARQAAESGKLHVGAHPDVLLDQRRDRELERAPCGGADGHTIAHPGLEDRGKPARQRDPVTGYGNRRKR